MCLLKFSGNQVAFSGSTSLIIEDDYHISRYILARLLHRLCLEELLFVS